ncbi:MAG: DUF4870 domain-containing protein [Phycisphaerae bacterium]|nr:DUF4870 domain-containing protein [Phycisphaerae bacterium]
MAEINEPPQPTGVSKDACMWAMLCHLLGLFTSFVGPLIIWMLKKEEDPFIDDQGKEALNFQITVGIAFLATGIVPIILRFLACVMPLLGLAVSITDIVFCIIACVAANKGDHYRYPVSIRFIK